MGVFSKLQELFLYAGVSKDEFNSLSPGIHDENKMLLKVFSQLAGIMFFLLAIVSMLYTGFATVNSSTYLVCGIIMLAITLSVNWLASRYPSLITALVYAFEIVLFAFSIRISMLHADKPAVSAVAFLLVTPLLFYDRPIRLCSLIAADVVLFCAMVLRFKQPEVANTDAWNMVTFGIVAIVTTLFIMSIKIRALSQSRQIVYLSQTDLLTGLKNRNYFESRLQEYPTLCKSNLICVYGDVNGLHEVNNEQGHVAGDKMLQEVAAAMQGYFGAEHTYRIGGDEFAALMMDVRSKSVSTELERMAQDLAGKGYHVSFGIAAREKGQGSIDMRELVKEAEDGMYAAKREFYQQPEHNRRRR